MTSTRHLYDNLYITRLHGLCMHAVINVKLPGKNTIIGPVYEQKHNPASVFITFTVDESTADLKSSVLRQIQLLVDALSFDRPTGVHLLDFSCSSVSSQR